MLLRFVFYDFLFVLHVCYLCPWSSLRMHQTICFVMLFTKAPKYLIVLNGLEATASETLQIFVLRTHLRKHKSCFIGFAMFLNTTLRKKENPHTLTSANIHVFTGVAMFLNTPLRKIENRFNTLTSTNISVCC